MLEDHREGHRNQKFMMGRKIKEVFPKEISLELSFSGQAEEYLDKKEKYPHMQRHRDIKNLVCSGKYLGTADTAHGRSEG